MLKEINGEKSLRNALANQLGLPQYKYVMENFNKVDVSKDEVFQRCYNGFYMVRRNQEWRKKYYDIFEMNKQKADAVTFENILCNIYVYTNMTEPSFSSKMLATLNPNMPIWDSRILDCLGFKLKGNSDSEKQDNAIVIYDQIVGWYQDYLQTDNAKKNIEIFDTYLPEYSWLTDVKKIDYMLWALG